MPDFGIFRGFNSKLFSDKLFAGQLPTQLGLIGSSIAADEDAVLFYNRVTTAGGTLSITEQFAINQLVLDLKSYGLWSKMKAIYPMVGASAAACRQNLKSSSFTGNFSTGWTYANTGVTPNGTNAYMDTNLNYNTVIGLNSTHYSYYSRTNSSSGFDIGCYAGGQENWMALNYSTSHFYYPNTAGLQISQTGTLGFFLGTFTINTINLFKNSSKIQTKTSSTYNSTNLNVYIGAANIGSPTLFSNHQCAFSSIGNGLTDTEAGNFYTAVNAFQTTLSRQV